jgi:hypothetical protein
MKPLLSTLVLTVLLTACLEDDCEETITYIGFEPIVAEAADWRTASFAISEPVAEVCEPSGFYVYGDILFVLDKQAGLHIIDNSDNANPHPLAFMGVPGGEGIAVRNNILYLNQYSDLLAFDISEPTAPELLSRTEEAFPYSRFSAGEPGDVVIGYAETEQTVELSCSSPRYGHRWVEDDGMIFATMADANRMQPGQTFALSSTAGVPQPEIIGTGGSLARFTISKQTLYVVDDQGLRTFSLADAANPEFVGTHHIGWGIETIFPSGDNLYIGAQNGMHIFGIGTDPHSPEYLSTFEHVRSCDPVVVDGHLAYVTLWGGSNCGDIGDRLMVIDVSDPRRPTLVQDLRQSNSHGLGLTADHLYLCSGPEGTKVFDLEDDGTVGGVVHLAGDFEAKDIIVRADRGEAIVFGWEQAGIRQYDLDEQGGLVEQGDIDICN